MNRQEIIRDMKKEIGSFPNISQIAKYLNVSRETVRAEIVKELSYCTVGKSHKYFVNDIADQLLKGGIK